MGPPRGWIVHGLSQWGRLLLTTPEGVEIEYAIQLGFNTTNNETKYEALIAGLSVAREAGAVRVGAYTDSKLVEGQVIGEYKAKEDQMKKISGQGL